MTREQIDAAIARYADQETLYDQPYRDNSRVRVTGPFTVEAVPAPTVRSLEDIEKEAGWAEKQIPHPRSPEAGDRVRDDSPGGRAAKADFSPTSAKSAAGVGMTTPGGGQGSLEDIEKEAGWAEKQIPHPRSPEAGDRVRDDRAEDDAGTADSSPTSARSAAGFGMTTPGGGQGSLADFRHAATPLLDASVARKGATLRHTEWRDELLKTGLRGKGGHHIEFSRVEPLAGTRWLHADAETKGAKPERVVISFGPEYSLLEQRQVELAWEEARTLSPKPAILVFAAFEFDPEAAKDIDGMTKEKTGMTFLTAQMNADLLTEDLKKKRASNESFWLVGRPDVEVRRATEAEKQIPHPRSPKAGDRVRDDMHVVEVRGFDYYNTRTGTIESGDTSKIAMWLLDTDYDGRSLYPRQVFFPMADDDEGWARLAHNLKAEIDSELIEKYRGTVSLPFEPGPHKRVAVKVIDDRGIESLKVVSLG